MIRRRLKMLPLPLPVRNHQAHCGLLQARVLLVRLARPRAHLLKDQRLDNQHLGKHPPRRLKSQRSANRCSDSQVRLPLEALLTWVAGNRLGLEQPLQPRLEGHNLANQHLGSLLPSVSHPTLVNNLRLDQAALDKWVAWVRIRAVFGARPPSSRVNKLLRLEVAVYSAGTHRTSRHSWPWVATRAVHQVSLLWALVTRISQPRRSSVKRSLHYPLTHQAPPSHLGTIRALAQVAPPLASDPVSVLQITLALLESPQHQRAGKTPWMTMLELLIPRLQSNPRTLRRACSVLVQADSNLEALSKATDQPKTISLNQRILVPAYLAKTLARHLGIRVSHRATLVQHGCPEAQRRLSEMLRRSLTVREMRRS